MTIIARLRLVLAILALVSAPIAAPSPVVAGAMAMPVAAMSGDMACDGHDCDDARDHGTVPHAAGNAACVLGCLGLHLPPLLLSHSPFVGPPPVSSRLTMAPAMAVASRRPLPPERPPRS